MARIELAKRGWAAKRRMKTSVTTNTACTGWTKVDEAQKLMSAPVT